MNDVSMCTRCGRENTDSKRQCVRCRGLLSAAAKRLADKRRSSGKCADCGKELDRRGRHCKVCTEDRRIRMRRSIDRRVSQELCGKCGKENYIVDANGRRVSFLCDVCYLRNMAVKHLGSELRWVVLVEKLDACGWRCPYTGEPLVLGDNLSFDHMDPVCRFPEKRHDPDNIEPISWQVNLMKRDLTKSEFLAMIERIHSNAVIYKSP